VYLLLLVRLFFMIKKHKLKETLQIFIFLYRPIKKIWHGSHANGKFHSADKHCRNWRSDRPLFKATASSIISYTPALNELEVRCDQKLIVLCLQIR